MHGRTPTKSEQTWMNKAREFGCIVCYNIGYETPAAIHHLDGCRKIDCHFKTIPLCYHHHQGEYGIGFHSGRVKWEATYGSQWVLLKQIQDLLI